MKRLLIITDMYPEPDNPVYGIFVKQQVDALAKKYDVWVIATRFPRKAHVSSYVLDNHNVTLIGFPLVLGIFPSSLITYWLYVCEIIKEKIRFWEPDIIHVHDCRHVPEIFILSQVLKNITIPKYLTVHNIKTHPDNVRNFLTKKIYKQMLEGAYKIWTNIFTVNYKLKQTISAFYPSDQIMIIGNAISENSEIDNALIEKYKPNLNRDAFNIITVANLVKEKGLDYLIRSVKKIVETRPNIHLYIIGDGIVKNELQKLIENLDLSDKVTLAGRVENPIVRNLYKFFDAFVLTSWSETFGIVYLEAMYAGLPVVGVRGQGIDGIIYDMENGLLTEPKNLESIIAKIEYLISHVDKRKTIGEKGRILVQNNYMIDGLIDRIVDVYER
jgi:teichuronic acid biosynthesis glycosyltransferase TuaC